jgi:hypothetical protein
MQIMAQQLDGPGERGDVSHQFDSEQLGEALTEHERLHAELGGQ